MDYLFGKQLSGNALSYKRSLDRIIEKYSKIQNEGIEVDLGNVKTSTLSRYMKQSKAELDKLDSQRLTELSDDSMRAQDTTGYSQLDFLQQNCGADETCVSGVSSLSSVSSTCISVQDEGELFAAGMCRSDTTQLTVGSLDESQRSVSEVEQQPEDQDEELERTLRSHGSLVELYPSMISRIERAVHRQHVSEAADSVLRRYRRWRQQSNRSLNLSNTFMSNQSRITPERRSCRENSGSPMKRRLTGTESSPRSHLQVITNQQDWQQQSPGRGRGSLRRKQHKPVLVMDLSGPPEIFKPKETSVNQTFTVSLNESLQDQPCVYSVSPSRPSNFSPKAPSDLSLRSKRLFNAAHALQTDGYTLQTAKERPDIYSSPVRQSPTKNRLMRSLSRSPLASSRSPRVNPVESFCREPVRPQSESTFLSSPQRRTPLPMTLFSSQDSNESFHLQHPPPHSILAAKSRHRLRRHLSFDSAMASSRVTHSPKKLDEDFIKLYHKFVCQHKSSFFKGPPCRFCARSSEANRGYSSSSLAALALSPHRSLLRKRHREPSLESHPQSKRFRDEYLSSSPGSRRYRTEMLWRSLSPRGSEQHYGQRSYSPSKLGEFQRFPCQQRPSEHHQDTWAGWSHHRSAAEFSGLGSPCKRSAPSGSPRKWW
ncbi:uncharacterized protein LOC141788594 [Halichoeres trimaculatus]|uniref:uncharacterized protein LOC141788594 n=1 Tax=Halichoeres trimaculatus TaxID=147232 RepID=UPI003D9DD222